MSFNDIFKSDFLDNAISISVTDMLIALGIAFLIGVFISFIYKRTYKGVNCLKRGVAPLFKCVRVDNGRTV